MTISPTDKKNQIPKQLEADVDAEIASMDKEGIIKSLQKTGFRCIQVKYSKIDTKKVSWNLSALDSILSKIGEINRYFISFHFCNDYWQIEFHKTAFI